MLSRMSLLCGSIQLRSTFRLWTIGKQQRAISLLYDHHFHCTGRALLVSVQRTIPALSGTRYYSHPTHIDTDCFGGELERNTETSSETKHSPKSKGNYTHSKKFQKKLHNRIFSEQELAENEIFLNKNFKSGDEDDAFGTFQRRQQAKMVSDHCFGSTLNTDAQDVLDQPETNSAVPRTHVSTGKTNEKFFERGQYIKQTGSWSDEFGTLDENDLADRVHESLNTSVGSHEERFSNDEDERESKHIRLSSVNRRHIPDWYGRKILKLGKKGQVREAIKMFEDWMLKQDRVMPNSYTFTCLITVLGRAGYTRKAFSLFNKMKKMGIQQKPATYTALFNACANSPWKEDGRTRADNLFKLMKEKEVEPTFITGKAMVKAFAICGDLRQAFSLVDDLSQIYRPDPEIFSFLLMACISDKESGLRHAIQVWRVMQQMGVQADLPLYNLLLRCVRDCGVGDTQSFTSLITGGAADSQQLDAGYPASAQKKTSHLLSDRKDSSMLELKMVEQTTDFNSPPVSHEQAKSEIPQRPKLEAADDSQISTEVEEQTHGDSLHSSENFHFQLAPTLQSSVTIPNILSESSLDSRIVSFGDLSTKENRLLLLGGVDGILSQMAKDGAKPNVITFTQLISVAMPTVEAEQRLLQSMMSLDVKPDIDLINALMHKRCIRADFDAARSVGALILDYGLTANQMTYGILAMTCKSQREAVQLLEDLEAADMAPNMEILGTLIRASGMKFGYKLWVVKQAQKLDLMPNTNFLRNVEKGLVLVRQKMLHAERQGEKDNHILSPEFQQSVEVFIQHYEAWLKQTQVQIPRHPWASFKPLPSDHKDTVSA